MVDEVSTSNTLIIGLWELALVVLEQLVEPVWWLFSCSVSMSVCPVGACHLFGILDVHGGR
jgi:hypothetical protein